MATQRWKNFDDTFIRFDTTHERDRQTRHRMTAKAALDATSIVRAAKSFDLSVEPTVLTDKSLYI